LTFIPFHVSIAINHDQSSAVATEISAVSYQFLTL
jgi:hypothetical protein